jgi:hypothetical protein
VGEQSLPGIQGQVSEQGQPHARIEVLLGEDPTDQLYELKPQKPSRSSRARNACLSRGRRYGRNGLPLLVVSC